MRLMHYFDSTFDSTFDSNYFCNISRMQTYPKSAIIHNCVEYVDEDVTFTLLLPGVIVIELAVTIGKTNVVDAPKI